MKDVEPLQVFGWLLSKEQGVLVAALLHTLEAKWKNDLGESMRERVKRGTKSSANAEVDKAMQESLDLFK
jgi:hypothetical protein